MMILKPGMIVYIRNDLVDGRNYGADCWVSGMKSGLQRVDKVFKCGDAQKFKIEHNRFNYTIEMIDLDKTFEQVDL